MAVGLSIVLSPISALVGAGTMSKLWEWFVARDYGSGPSMSAWFGISEIASVVLATALLNVTREKRGSSDSPFMAVIGQAVGMWVGMALILGIAWVTGFALHWV